ncbi:MAG: UDP-N-acetylmuramoyl-L-alanine--D-glutamate ligase [Solobacterium sp.]|nr:UDP-N-acetylmuramoyl-L-alanine--D-glutamate ligase [Solobacterium sp.]
MSLTSWKEDFEGKRVLIWGYGMEGRSSYRFIRRLLPQQTLYIADTDASKIAGTENTVFVKDEDVSTDDYDLVLKSPGIVVREGMDLEKISGEAPLFLKHYRDRTVGITATKGKSTTTSLTAAILKKKINAILVGNIGIACFDIIDEMENGAVAVFEIACHHLEYAKESPHVGVLMNLYEEHLDHYGSFEKYGAAKANVFRHQKKGDLCLLGKDLKDFIAESINRPVLIGSEIRAEGRKLITPDRELEIKDCRLIGAHNYQNLAVAYYIGQYYGVSDEQVIEAAREFVPLHHRIEDLGCRNGIRYINDSISTIGQSCIQALKALDDVDVVLVGGMDRGIDYDELEQYLASRDTAVVFMYGSGKRIFEEMKNKGLARRDMVYCEDLETAVRTAEGICRPAHSILLSPAASSYDHFKNFEQRGEIFRRLAFDEMESH